MAKDGWPRGCGNSCRKSNVARWPRNSFVPRLPSTVGSGTGRSLLVEMVLAPKPESGRTVGRWPTAVGRPAITKLVNIRWACLSVRRVGHVTQVGIAAFRREQPCEPPPSTRKEARKDPCRPRFLPTKVRPGPGTGNILVNSFIYPVRSDILGSWDNSPRRGNRHGVHFPFPDRAGGSLQKEQLQ
jgi:hypothetical protein